MFLKIMVLVVAILQVVAAGLLSIGTFETTERVLPVFIQPASWAFGVWGVIYALSIVYAIYQVVPKFDNATLQVTRVPALVGMIGAASWLYFAGMDNWSVWLTIPILFGVAYAFTYVVTAPESGDLKQDFFSKYALLPFAAWTAVACWINLPALLLDQSIVTDPTVNLWINLVLFVGIVVGTTYYFRQSQYNFLYGGIMVWAAVAVTIVNYQRESWTFVVLAALFALVTAWQYVSRRLL